MQECHDGEDFVNCAVTRHDAWIHHYKPDSKNKQAVEWKHTSPLTKTLKHKPQVTLTVNYDFSTYQSTTSHLRRLLEGSPQEKWESIT
jgi:hypothetical protein